MKGNNKMDRQQIGAMIRIFAAILGVIALIFSWIPFINNIALMMALIGLLLIFIGLIIDHHYKHWLTWFGMISSIIALGLFVVAQRTYVNNIEHTFSSKVVKTASSQHTKKSSSIEVVSSRSSSYDDSSDNVDPWTFSGNTLHAGDLTYTLTHTELMDSLEQDGSSVLVIHMDVTNHAKTNKDPAIIYRSIRAYQENDTSRFELYSGDVAWDQTNNNPIYDEEETLENEILPGKTIHAATTFKLKNSRPVTLEFLDADFDKIGTKKYTIQ